MSCVNCREGLDHCHGTVIRHVDDTVECTDTGCTDVDVVRHTLVVDCDTVDGGCVCAGQPGFAVA